MTTRNYLLLPHHKKRVLNILIEHGIDPNDFVWGQEEIDVGTSVTQMVSVSVIKYTPSNYWFRFGVINDYYGVAKFQDSLSPGENSYEDTFIHSSSENTWEARFQMVEKWADYLVRELDAHEFLTALTQVPTLKKLTELGIDNRPFTVEEQKEIAEKLAEIEKQILNLTNLYQHEQEYIHVQFEQLRQESKRMGRTGWFQMLIGCLVSIGSAFFDLDKVGVIWEFAESLFSNLPRLK